MAWLQNLRELEFWRHRLWSTRPVILKTRYFKKEKKVSKKKLNEKSHKADQIRLIDFLLNN